LSGFGWQFVGFVVGFFRATRQGFASYNQSLRCYLSGLSGSIRRREPQRIWGIRNARISRRRDFGFQGPQNDGRWSHSWFLRVDCGVRAKAEILNPFQSGVGFIPRKERDHECNDCDDQGQVFHQRLPKHLGAQNDDRSWPASRNSRKQRPAGVPHLDSTWTPERRIQTDYRP
jgi:hypothetical protein